MREAELNRAIAAALAIVSSHGLPADEAVVLQNSNKIALRLLPCDVMARVARASEANADFEIGLARALLAAGGPIAALEPRVEQRGYEHDGFVITLWTYYPSTQASAIPPKDYADALRRLHIGMREIDVRTPHVTDRVASAHALVADPCLSPALADVDRELLTATLRRLRGTVAARPNQQLLHGEPHPGNVLVTQHGLLFIDFETCCTGPIEFDLAHAPEDVCTRYPDADPELLRECRILVLAMVCAWRWDRHDQLPDGKRLGLEWLRKIRDLLETGT